ncbi:MAG: AMMECR1 domain-containing protein [Phycisphaerae bacterium]|nr:AMMECR1 domain-containing protein [Phycisphaerae bacterium]
MVRYTLIALVVFSAAGAWGQAGSPGVAAIQVDADDGPVMVRLARDAMAEYLVHRTPAETQAIPASLAHLEREKWTYAANVTLRHEGRTVGRAFNASLKNERGIPQPASVCRNVIAAALKAMRSEDLPDVITQAYLESLTIEVEILSPPKAVEPPPGRKLTRMDVERLVTPGQTGLRVVRGADEVYLLPSDGYVMGMDATGICQAAVMSIPQTPGSDATMECRYWLLESRHFVGYGDVDLDDDTTPKLAGRVLCLARGKADVNVSGEAIAMTLPRVVRFLAANQTKEGLYKLGQTAPPLRDHLAAACAMLRAGKHLENDDVCLSGMKALEYVWQQCREEEGRAYVAADPAEDQYGATAMFAYALSLSPRDRRSEAFYSKLIRTLLAGIGKDGWPSARLDGQPGERAPLRDALLAYTVLLGGAGTEEEIAAYGAMQKALMADWPASATAEDALWRLRAGLGSAATPMDPLKFVSQILPGQDNSQGRNDESGGFAFGLVPASVELTALALSVQTAGQDWSGQPLPADPARRAMQLSVMTTWAQAFVYTMTYRPHEAYFAKHPATWLGAVRADAGAARVTPAACAAAIEILLMETPGRQE